MQNILIYNPHCSHSAMPRRQQPSMQPAGHPTMSPMQDALRRQHHAADQAYVPGHIEHVAQHTAQYPHMPDVAPLTDAEIMLRQPQRTALSPPAGHRRQGSAASASSAFSVASAAPDTRVYLDQQHQYYQQQHPQQYQQQQEQYYEGMHAYPGHKYSGSAASVTSDTMTSPFATHSSSHSHASSPYSHYQQQQQQQWQQGKAVKAVWAPKKPPQPFRTKFAPLAFLLFVSYLAALGYYFYVRVSFTLDMGIQTW